MVVTSVPDHRILHVNVPARPWVGECQLDPWRTGLEPGVRARFFQRLSDRDAVDEFEVRWLGGAEPTWAVLSARRLVYQGQDAVLTAFTPINVLKVMEQRLELWAKVFEASSEGIIIMNAQRKVVSVNAAFCRSTGYEYYEVLGEEMGFLLEGQGPDWAALTDMAGCLAGRGAFPPPVGRDLPGLAHGVCGARGQGPPPHRRNLIGIAIDITDRKAKEERIRFLAQHDVLTELPNRALCQCSA
jgi:PAS domain-containing protein